MQYISTRDKQVKVSAAQAIAQGISRESGLFVPEALPRLDRARLERLAGMDYIDRACDILGDFLTDFTPEEIRSCVEAAYGGDRFADPAVAPLSRIHEDTWLLELWHGPTCAFKDMALQLLPHLLTRSVEKVAGGREIAILVVTSGDTGKAALEGFRDVPGTEILVFYPHGGVSEIQRLQMATQEGDNVGVCAVEGNFDDTQTAVKQIFTDPAVIARLEGKNKMFSSANSINWGRLVPQIVYYVSAYCDLVEGGELKMGDTLNVSVPTGNFGNILAAYYAKQMGLPLGRLICASNINNVLTDFIRSGAYDRRREFHLTTSPSMDILISSNLERLLFALYGNDDAAVAALMGSLSEEGCYTISDAAREKLQQEFYGGFCDEQTVADTVRDTYTQTGYLMDTHTAVACAVRDAYQRETGDNTTTLVVSTANPYKFAGSILRALRGVDCEEGMSEFEQANMLAKLTRTEIPPQILALQEKPVRFDRVCEKPAMADYVCTRLGV